MIRIARESDIPQLKILWKNVFYDEDIFLQDFFHMVFPEIRALCYTAEGKILSMMYLFPGMLREAGREIPVCYFYALATDESYRGQGIMGQMIGRAKQMLLEDMPPVKIYFLIPARKSLFAYYKKFGFLREIEYHCAEGQERNLFFPEALEKFFQKYYSDELGKIYEAAICGDEASERLPDGLYGHVFV